jgi:hypothetical protein
MLYLISDDCRQNRKKSFVKLALLQRFYKLQIQQWWLIITLFVSKLGSKAQCYQTLRAVIYPAAQ